MPTYEYTCKQCGERLEVFQSFSAKPLRKHAGCGGELRKIFHARGIVFKGSGFYATDVRASSGSSNGESKSESKKSEDKKSESKKSEGKPSSNGQKSEPAKTGASSSSPDD